jgi:D-alanine transfer protein
MKTAHLLPALSALGLVAVVLTAGYFYARWVEARAVPVLADPSAVPLLQHETVQQTALHRRHVLPMYGTSELIYADPYHASRLFRQHPDGFTPLPFAQHAVGTMVQFQKLAVLGSELRGRKVVVSFTPSDFLQKDSRDGAYISHFSPLAASELVFSTHLSVAVKRAAARRMLQYPQTLEHEPLTRFALEKLAEGSSGQELLYYASLPLGLLQNLNLRIQDQWDALGGLRRELAARSAQRRRGGSPLDWETLLCEAEQESQRRADNNPFGFDNEVWQKVLRQRMTRQKNSESDERFCQRIAECEEWQDLDLLLRGLRDLGAEPLLVSTPLNGAYFEHLGVSRQARQAYYDRLQAVAAAHGVPVEDFAEHDEDRYFLIDPSHLSSKGWVFFDRVLDGFYHDERAYDRSPRMAVSVR